MLFAIVGREVVKEYVVPTAIGIVGGLVIKSVLSRVVRIMSTPAVEGV